VKELVKPEKTDKYCTPECRHFSFKGGGYGACLRMNMGYCKKHKRQVDKWQKCLDTDKAK
jgi:hypothetical protein